MSFPPPGPLGYQADPPPPLILPGRQEPPESLARRIDAAVAAVPLERRGSIVVSLDRTRGSIAVMGRVGDNVKLLAQVTKPYAGSFAAEVGVRVDFLVRQPDAPLPPRQIGLRDCYHALRHPFDGAVPNGRFRAVVKAIGLVLGAEPYLDGKRWFA